MHTRPVTFSCATLALLGCSLSAVRPQTDSEPEPNFTSPRLEVDSDDCAQGFLSTDIIATVDSESVRFGPLCGFSFDEHFETKTGRTCVIESGMCSDFQPRGRVDLRCNGASSVSASLDCQGPLQDASPSLSVDEDDCADGSLGAEIRVEIDGENQRFSPSCGFSLHERFESELGRACVLESRMCSGSESRAEVELRCDNALSQTANLRCPED